jgi:hypothetical protein
MIVKLIHIVHVFPALQFYSLLLYACHHEKSVQDGIILTIHLFMEQWQTETFPRAGWRNSTDQVFTLLQDPDLYIRFQVRVHQSIYKAYEDRPANNTISSGYFYIVLFCAE